MDDIFFEKLMEDPDVCEEILQTILENPLLRINKETVAGQKSIRIIGKRSVRVDAYTKGARGEIYNIEIQKANDDNHVAKLRALWRILSKPK